MRESLLHYIWRSGLFNQSHLQTTCGREVVILSAGEYNIHSGPDFLNAIIKIAGTTWAGNVEIHLRSSNWFEHGHQYDSAYQNTILHVVFEHDTERQLYPGLHIPTLELRGRFDPSLEQKQQLFESSMGNIPCAALLHKAKKSVINNWLYEMAEARLQSKASQLDTLLTESKNSWEQVLFMLLCRHFGMLVNRQPFEMLARSLTWNIMQRQQATDIEALLIGQAGLLQSSFRDTYPRKLKERYAYLAHKFSLQPIDVSLWKLMRMRPSGFPATRLSQLAALLSSQSGLFSQVLELESYEKAMSFFQISASEYWATHYRFDDRCTRRSTRLGKQGIELLIINVLVPTLYSYGRQRNIPGLKDRAVMLLRSVSAENNRITRAFSDCGLESTDAFASQALYHLKNEFCDKRECLNCGIGIELFRNAL